MRAAYGQQNLAQPPHSLAVTSPGGRRSIGACPAPGGSLGQRRRPPAFATPLGPSPSLLATGQRSAVAQAGYGPQSPLPRPPSPGPRSSQRLFVRGYDPPLPVRRGQGHHRLSLQRLSVLPPPPQREAPCPRLLRRFAAPSTRANRPKKGLTRNSAPSTLNANQLYGYSFESSGVADLVWAG